MADASLMYFQEKLGKTQPRILTFAWEITGAKTVSEIPQGIPVLYSFDAITQASIDAFLTSPYVTSSSEFDGDAFDATSMGTDAFGGIVNMREQCDSVLWMRAETHTGAAFNTYDSVAAVDAGTLSTSTLPVDAEVAASSAGNIGFKFVLTGLDADTAGLMMVQIGWLAK